MLQEPVGEGDSQPVDDPDLQAADRLAAMLSPRKLVVRGANVLGKYCSPMPVSWIEFELCN